MSTNTTTLGSLDAPGERLHALDAVRAGALLLGVVLHAAMSFLPGEQVWAVKDAPNEGLGVLFFVTHIFRMSLFFLIAGFFARLALHRKGLRAFVRDRFKRIAVPLMSFWPLMFGSLTAIFIWGIVRQHGVEALQALPQPQGGITQTFPWTHLWFLYVLLGLYAGALALRALVLAVDRRGHVRRALDATVRVLVDTAAAPFVLAVPTCLALYFREEWLMWLGVPTPDYGLVPNAPASAAYGVAFAFGWLLHRQADLLRLLERRWLPHLVAGVGLSAVCVSIAGVSAVTVASTQSVAYDPVSRLIVAACYPLATWAWTFGLIGMAMRFLSAHNPVIRYAADASYWVYLVHLPLVMAAQVLVFPLQLPALAKFALVLAISTPLMPLSYHLLVRHTFLGALLNGRRHQRRGGTQERERSLQAAA